MILRSLGAYRDVGLLVLRVGIGLSFLVAHGWPKLIGGVEMWEKIGGAMGGIGITFLPVFWGFMAAVTEALGGLLFAIGFAFRPVSILLAFTMLIAVIMHLKNGDGLGGSSHAIELFFVFVAMIFVGPGRHSVDRG